MRARSGSAMPVKRAWPAFEARTAQRRFVAVERQRVGADLLAPERGLEFLAEAARPRPRAARRARDGRALSASLGDRALGGEDVALHLAERDRPARAGTVGMEDRVVTNPSSPGSPGRHSVSREYSTKPSPSTSPYVSIQPSAASMLGQIASDRLDVAGALEILAGEHQEERRRIDRAVVAAERHLAEIGHLAVTDLVQDFSGLRVRFRVVLGRLRRGEDAQHACARSTDRPTASASR